MDKGLDSEKPDLVVVNGDLITSGCASALEMKQPMNNVARSMEQRRVPWVITSGNHDEDSMPDGGLAKAEQATTPRARSPARISRAIPPGTGSR